MKGDKISSKNAYVKVEDLDVGSNSERKSDHLSFSYSCVKSFRKNQHIIGDLAALHAQHDYQGIDHQPGLFSLSGRRNRPICQPFYCSTVPENCSDESFNCDQEQPVIEKDKNVIKTESQQHFPVKDLLFQWFKYHFKLVNSLWSFTVPKESFISKFCKRNRNMKMEMTLYSVDEETKRRLINYIKKSNLGYEEHCNLCNETVFEIDVTPILNDTQRLQNFMSFLKSIESENSKVSSKNSPDLNEFVNNKHELEKNSFKEKFPRKKVLYELDKSHRKPAILEKRVYQTSLSTTSIETNKNFIPKQKKDNFKNNSNNQDLNIETNEIICPQHDEENSKKFPQKGKKARNRSTLSRTNDAQHLYDREAMTSEKHNKSTKQKTFHFERLCCNLQTNEENNPFISTSDSGLSCKCLMHHNREDYYRYRNQCLFGKGDQITNNFSKYTNQRNEPCIYLYENQLKSFPSEVDGVKKVQKVKISKSDESLDTKTNFQTESENNIFLENFGRVSLKQDLNSKDNYNDSLKENLCSKQFSSMTTEDNIFIKEEDSKELTNACFESLNYCFNTFSNTDNESIARRKAHGKNNIYCSVGHNSSKQLHKEHTNHLEKSLECSGQSQWEKNKKIVKNGRNNDFTLKDNDSSENYEITGGSNINMQRLRNNTSKSNGINQIFHEEGTLNFNNKANDNQSRQKDYITDCEINYKTQPKVKLITFRIGNSEKQLRYNSVSVSKKINNKSKSNINANAICRKISSVSKGNGSVCNEECSITSWTDMKTDENTNDCSITEDCNSFTDSFTTRSKGKKQTIPQMSADIKLSSLSCYKLETLVSELKNQRKEIDSMKKILMYIT